MMQPSLVICLLGAYATGEVVSIDEEVLEDIKNPTRLLQDYSGYEGNGPEAKEALAEYEKELLNRINTRFSHNARLHAEMLYLKDNVDLTHPVAEDRGRVYQHIMQSIYSVQSGSAASAAELVKDLWSKPKLGEFDAPAVKIILYTGKVQDDEHYGHRIYDAAGELHKDQIYFPDFVPVGISKTQVTLKDNEQYYLIINQDLCKPERECPSIRQRTTSAFLKATEVAAQIIYMLESVHEDHTDEQGRYTAVEDTQIRDAKALIKYFRIHDPNPEVESMQQKQMANLLLALKASMTNVQAAEYVAMHSDVMGSDEVKNCLAEESELEWVGDYKRDLYCVRKYWMKDDRFNRTADRNMIKNLLNELSPEELQVAGLPTNYNQMSTLEVLQRNNELRAERKREIPVISGISRMLSEPRELLV